MGGKKKGKKKGKMKQNGNAYNTKYQGDMHWIQALCRREKLYSLIVRDFPMQISKCQLYAIFVDHL